MKINYNCDPYIAPDTEIVEMCGQVLCTSINGTGIEDATIDDSLSF